MFAVVIFGTASTGAFAAISAASAFFSFFANCNCRHKSNHKNRTNNNIPNIHNAHLPLHTYQGADVLLCTGKLIEKSCFSAILISNQGIGKNNIVIKRFYQCDFCAVNHAHIQKMLPKRPLTADFGYNGTFLRPLIH